MERRPLGDSGLQVSLIGLGTMTFGEQNSEAEGHRQLDCALDHGVNLIDTAEMYPVPPRARTQGATETIIGRWLARRGTRDRVILATKVAGPGRDWITHIRGGGNRLDRANIRAAVEGSLRRLQTDYIDYYQIHWPDRPAATFGRRAHPWQSEPGEVPVEETLEALDELVREGKVRHIGVSNETPWGVMRYLELARQRGWARICGIQNPYSLLNRSFETGLAEVTQREGVGLLAYSPLGFGVLSGKYLGGARPEGSRLARFPEYRRYSAPQAELATEAYVHLARAAGLDPAQMALAFVHSRPFTTSTLIGATTLEQLERNLRSVEVRLSPEVEAGIEAIHRTWTDPAP